MNGRGGCARAWHHARAPLGRFEREEKAALRPLPSRALPRRQQRIKRKVANDALVDVDTVRYSVPHRLVRESVEVQVGEAEVRIFHAGKLVATHCYRARLLMEIWTGWLMGISQDEQARSRLTDGSIVQHARGWDTADDGAIIRVRVRLVDGDLDRLVDGHQRGRTGARHTR